MRLLTKPRQVAWFATAVLTPLMLLSVGGCPINPPDGVDNGNGNDNGGGGGGGTTMTGNTGIGGAFVGSTRCSLCHSNIHTSWTGTLHAKAYEALEAIGQQNNAECLPCHTVGFGQSGGFVNRATTNDLAGVGCEACHGGAGTHANNASDASLRPQVDISSNVCGRCHTGAHQPNFDDWQMSKHAGIQASLVTSFTNGSNAASCGQCHSGDVFYARSIKGETVANNFLAGRTADQLNPITCAVCHNPHSRTGNAATPEDGRDYQLRFAQIKYTTPTVSLTAAQDVTRFNLCGQCHHTRDRVWTDSSREPHPSDQVNVFFGELPVPDSQPTPIVAARSSVHLNTPEQCSTCHVFRTPATGLAPTVSGHTFEVNFDACADCHGSRAAGEAKLAGLKAELDFRVELLEEALDEWAQANDIDGKGLLSWEYTSEGGPAAAGQNKIPDDIKKARYILYYVIAGGGNGAHNPDFVRDALIQALEYAETAPPRLP
ncbi:MAG: ammonia-forming cytochrome c nitrite reductase subunit c552 [Phycisphaerae bacterium]